MNTTNSETKVAIPVLLSFDHERTDLVAGRKVPGIKLGRGEAGWTVVQVSESKVAEFLRAHRASWMPGTKRIAARYGV